MHTLEMWCEGRGSLLESGDPACKHQSTKNGVVESWKENMQADLLPHPLTQKGPTTLSHQARDQPLAEAVAAQR